MKWTVVCVFCLSLLSTAATTRAQDPFSGWSMQSEPFPLYRRTLPNGLHVWVQPRLDSESVTTLLVLRAGSRYEVLSNSGVSHFVEHMVFTGTERWTEQEIKEIISRRGGRWNGWTGMETTTYFAQMAADDLDIALDWLAEVVFHPTFPVDKVEKERQVIFQERWGRYGWLINMLDDLGFGYELDRDIRRALFPESTLGLRVVGEDASLDKLDRAALMDYYRRHYTPNNATLIVVGNVTLEQVFVGAEKNFGDLEAKARPAPPDTPSLPDEGPHLVTVRGPLPTDQARLMMGARAVGRTHPDRWPLAVLAEVLDKELTEEIRYRQGLVYGLWAYNVSLDDTGYFVVSTTSKQANQEAIQRTLEERVEQIRQGEVDAEAVAEAQSALKGRWALAMEDNVERAKWLAQWSSVLSADEPVPDYQALIGAVTPEDLPRLVGTYFVPQSRYIGRHLPVATVASGARAAVIGITLAVGLWGARKLRRRAQARRRRA